MIELGKYNTLRILRDTNVGLYLGDEATDEVLLPTKYCPENISATDEIKVFIHHNNEGRKVATNLIPKIHLYEFAFLQVKAVAEGIGAFLDWGVDKDLMVPFREQKEKMETDRWYIIYLDIDTKTDRLYGSNKVEKFVHNESITVKENDEVDVLIWKQTDMGFSVVVNNMHTGLIFENEIFKPLNIGDKMKGFVKKIRDDNKIDISLQPIGYENFIDANSEIVYRELAKHKGFLSITDKSMPDEIYLQFGMSKKAFKRALGSLYKLRKIEILPEGIKLV